MWKKDHRAMKIENMTLRDALREANAELLKHRRTIAALGAGQRDVTEQVERVLRAR